MHDRTRLIVPALVVLACISAVSLGHGDRSTGEPLPSSLTDAEFWALITDLSEPNGYFRSDNLVSNEHTYQYVIPRLIAAVRPGGVYLGVAPDQNFTYMIATRPQMAFIVDVRRGNLLQHLMYKALFELSDDRVGFVSRLFSKPRPPGLTASSTVTEIFTGFARTRREESLYLRNVTDVRTHLLESRGFDLSPSDLEELEAIHFAFYRDGPGIRYSTASRGFGGRGSRGFPSYEALMMQTDWSGTSRSYLATEEHFTFVRNLQRRNLIVPVVGNFAGPRALRAVGQYIRRHGSTVSAFYVSNVEQYLFQDGLWDVFAANVATLPLDSRSTFIRSVSARYGYAGEMVWADQRATALDPIQSLVSQFEAGKIGTYYDVNIRSR